MLYFSQNFIALKHRMSQNLTVSFTDILVSAQ